MMHQHTHSQQRQRLLDALDVTPRDDFLARLMLVGKLAMIETVPARPKRARCEVCRMPVDERPGPVSCGGSDDHDCWQPHGKLALLDKLEGRK